MVRIEMFGRGMCHPPLSVSNVARVLAQKVANEDHYRTLVTQYEAIKRGTLAVRGPHYHRYDEERWLNTALDLISRTDLVLREKLRKHFWKEQARQLPTAFCSPK